MQSSIRTVAWCSQDHAGAPAGWNWRGRPWTGPGGALRLDCMVSQDFRVRPSTPPPAPLDRGELELALCPFFFFFFNDTATTEIYTLSLHDALPILMRLRIIPGTLRNRFKNLARF